MKLTNSTLKICEKDGNYGIIVYDNWSEVDILGSFSSKTRMGGFRAIENPNEADIAFKESVDSTLKNGWKFVWEGDRNWG